MDVKAMLAGAALAIVSVGGAVAAECNLSDQGKAGKTAAAACLGCHEFTPGAPAKPTGPNLAGVFGSKAGADAKYGKYSEAIKAAGEKLVWDEASIMAYVGDPKAFLASINGKEMKHGMFFALKDEGKRKDIAVFLKELKACR